MRPLILAAALFLAASPPVLATGPADPASLPVGGGYGAIAAPRDIDAVGLGEAFCLARMLDDMSRVAGHLAPKLEALVAGAGGDIPWQAVAVRPTGCTVAVLNGYSDTIGVLLELRYTAAGQVWRDTLNLERAPDTWLINNVFYDGGGNLRFRLIEQRR